MWQEYFGMEKITLRSNVECMAKIDCYRYKDMFLRLDTFKDGNELIYCIEAAENQDFAQNNIFEDAWLYPESFGTDKMLSEMKIDLQNA